MDRVQTRIIAALMFVAPIYAQAAQMGSVADQWIRAVATADFPELNRLLASGVDPMTPDSRGTPALIGAIALVSPQDAANTPKVVAVREMIAHSAQKLNLTDAAYVGDSRAPLHMAAAVGSLPLVQALIQAGASIDQPNRFGETALFLASERGHALVVRFLIEQGASVNVRSRHTRMTPLMAAAASAATAASEGHFEAIRNLLAFGADASASNVFGHTAEALIRKCLGRATLSEEIRIQAVEALQWLSHGAWRSAAKL